MIKQPPLLMLCQHRTKRNTVILRCFLQFTCTNLDGSQREWGNFLNLLQKERGTQKGGGGGFPQKRGVPTMEETMQNE